MRVLLIRLSSLGDVALVSAVLDGLGEHEVWLLTYEPYGELFLHDPRVRVLQVRKGEFPWEIARKIRGRFDLVADLHSKPLTWLVSSLSGFKVVRYRKRALARRAAVWFKKPIGFVPVFRLYCEALERGLGRKLPCRPKLFPPPEGPGLPEGAVVLAPGGQSRARRWPWFGKLAEILTREGFVPVWVGLEGEGEGKPGVNLLGKTSIPQLLWVISRARAVISGDTFAVHLARGLGVKAIAIFGPTVPELGFGLLPQEGINLGKPLRCRPCSLHGNPIFCPYRFKCLKEISPEEVAAALRSLLRG